MSTSCFSSGDLRSPKLRKGVGRSSGRRILFNAISSSVMTDPNLEISRRTLCPTKKALHLLEMVSNGRVDRNELVSMTSPDDRFVLFSAHARVLRISSRAERGLLGEGCWQGTWVVCSASFAPSDSALTASFPNCTLDCHR